jgi:drug/metabolite transporter (DMT)-like permease
MTAQRTRSTSHGTNREAFTTADWALFVSLALIWGSSFLFIAIGLDSFHPGLVTLLRVGLGAGFLALIPRARAIKIDREDRGRVATLALIWVAIPFTLFPIAQQWIDSAVAGMLNGATPIFTALIATLLFRSSPGPLQIAGLGVGFVGILAIALPSAGDGTTAAIGVILVVIATVGYAISLNILPPLQRKYGSLPLMARILSLATVMVAPFGLVGLGDSSFAWSSLLAVAAIGVLGTGLAFILMGTLTGSVGATRASFITYLIPVVALVLGVLFRSEVISPIAVAGVLLVIVGALLASRRETRAAAAVDQAAA